MPGFADGELLGPAASLKSQGGKIGPLGSAKDLFGEEFRLTRGAIACDDAFRRQLGESGKAGGNHGQAGGQGLHKRKRETFIDGGKNKEIESGEKVRDIVAGAMEEHAVGDSQGIRGLGDCCAARSIAQNVQLRFRPHRGNQGKRTNQSDMVFGGDKASDATDTKARKSGRGTRGVGGELLDVDPVVDDRGVAPRKAIPGEVILADAFGNEYQGVGPAHAVTPNAFAVGIPVQVSAVTGVDDDGNTGEAGGYDGVMENQGIVGVKYVRAIDAESGGEVADESQREACRFAKGMHGHAGGCGFGRPLTWVGSAVDRGGMAFGLLLEREVQGEALQSAEIKAR